ncbi:MAG: response regulator, partial [Leptolyngbya sp. SIO3F4]|nr:response regulator [Leptolyngbya sp. SIO3F4]
KFSVTDTGIGIRREKMEELFEPFKQLDSSTTRKYGGTGLGLAISKKLVEAMQGDIWAESEYGTGSRFYFTVTLKSSSARLENSEAQGDPSFSIKKALVMEGNRPIPFHIADLLKRWGTEQVTLAHPDTWKAHKTDPDTELIVVDLGDRTWEADQLIRIQKSKRVQIPILLIMEHPPSVDTGEHMNYIVVGADQPLGAAVLYEKVTSLLESHERVRKASDLPKELADAYKLHILVVEDNLVNQKLAMMILERLGYRVDVAANGIEALEAVNRQPYDLIFMDIQMPELDGFGATERIRELLPPDKQPIIVAMTANAMAGDRERCLEAGMDDYIPKPINLAVVREMIIRWGTKINAQKQVDSLL